jgi:hypothetical protein
MEETAAAARGKLGLFGGRPMLAIGGRRLYFLDALS